MQHHAAPDFVSCANTIRLVKHWVEEREGAWKAGVGVVAGGGRAGGRAGGWLAIAPARLRAQTHARTHTGMTQCRKDVVAPVSGAIFTTFAPLPRKNARAPPSAASAAQRVSRSRRRRVGPVPAQMCGAFV